MKRLRNREVTTHQLIFTLIFLLGAFLRFFNLGTVRHGFDEGFPAYDALRFIEGGEWLWVGQPSSIFVDNPPLMAYLQAIPLLIYRSPWSVYLFITLLNTLAIWFVYRTAQELLGDRPGLVAAFLFAVSPWVVYFSQLPWHQGLVPFFTAVIAWGLWPTFTTNKGTTGRFLAGLLAVTALCLTYVQALGILAQVIPLLILFRRRVPRRAFLAGSGVFFAGMLLYAYGLSREWATSRVNLSELGGEGSFGLTFAGFNHAVRLVTGRDYAPSFIEIPAGEQWWLWLATIAHFLLLLLLVAGVVQAILALRDKNNRYRPLATVLLVWFGVPVLLTTFSPFPVHPHYLLLTLPAGHLLAAWGLAPALDRPLLRPVSVAGAVALALLAGINLQRTGAAYAAQPAGADFNGWTLAAGSELGRTIRELSAGDAPRRVVADGEAAVISSLSATYLDTEREMDADRYLLLPAGAPLLYVQVNRPAGLPLLPPEFQQTYPDRNLNTAGGTAVEFTQVRPVSREEALSLAEVPVDWSSDAGLSLLGYTIQAGPGAERTLQVTTVWRVDELHPEREDWFVGSFYHLRDQGQILVNLNEHGWWGDEWREGDVYLEQITLSVPEGLPPGRYELAISLFDPLHGQGFPLHSPAGSIPALVIPVDIPA